MKINTKGLILHQELSRKSSQGGVLFADRTPYENVGTKLGSVLKFDGTDDYVRVSDNASLDLTTTASVFAWVKGVSQVNTIIGKYDFGTNKRSWRLRATSTKGYVELSQDGSVRINATTLTDIFDGNWHFVGFTFNAGVLKIYADGVLEDTTTSETITSIYQSDIDVAIASSLYNNSPVELFAGSIGDTRIYSRVLSDTEVNTLYRGGVVDDTGLVANYKMKDKSGTTLTDETATNNGTLTNFTDTTAGYGDTHDSGWTTNDTPIVYGLDRKGNEGGISFDGTSSHINTNLGFSAQDYITTSFWINTAVNTSDWRWILDGGQNLLNGSYGIVIPQSSLGIQYRYSSGVSSTETASFSNVFSGYENVWIHLVFVADYVNKTVKLYRNGIQYDSTQVMTTPVKPTTTFTNIGYYNTNNYYLNGSIDDVRIYNRVLTQPEITLLYESYKSKLSI